MSASARAVAREGFVAGDVTFAEAYSHLVDAELWASGVLEGRLLALAEEGVQRVMERDRLLDAYGDVSGLVGALEATHDTERRAEALEREVLQAAIARRTQHPELVAPPPPAEPLAEDASEEDRLRAAAASDASLAHWRATVRTLLVSAVRPDAVVAPAVIVKVEILEQKIY